MYNKSAIFVLVWWGMDNIFFQKIAMEHGDYKVAIKDSIDIEGYKTVAGSPSLMDVEPAEKNAKIVDLLIDGHCQIIAKTNLHELAFGITGINQFTGTATNPKYPDLIPGGSSSGSAAAVAAQWVDFSIGTDTGGSIRMPAACCGVIGLKPTFGRVSREGILPEQTSLDCVGPFANNMAHIIHAMSIIDPSFEIQKTACLTQVPRLAWLDVDADAQIWQSVEQYLTDCQLNDLPKVPVASFNQAYRAGMSIINYETWQAYQGLVATGRVGADVAERLLKASKTTEQDVADANVVRQQFSTEIDALLEQFDALILPTLPQFPPQVVAAGNTSAFLNMTALIRPFNLSGHPAISLPLEADNGLPVGLQIISKHYQDEQLCAIAHFLMCARLSHNKESL